MALPIELWLIHPSAEMCDAFRMRFEGLPRVTVLQSRFEDLPATRLLRHSSQCLRHYERGH